MRLTQFIEQNHGSIIQEWVEFARSLLPWAHGMTEQGLRDHADELVAAVVREMELFQTEEQRSDKSKGRVAGGALGEVAHKHAIERLESGLKLDQMVAEYRALRANILRRWGDAYGDKDGAVTRFNEAIDETLAQAAVWYTNEMQHTREQFLGVLSHDLRNPLGAIIAGATLLAQSERSDDQQARIATRILSSASRMSRMVSDLLDLTRTRLGAGIPIRPGPMDLASVCEQVIAELEAIHPTAQLQFESTGEVRGTWDSDRLTQVVSNLVANAIQYGGKRGPVAVAIQKRGDVVVLEVRNQGALIPKDFIKRIFEPMVRQPSQTGDKNITGLGLGLYIAREIVISHGGTIGVTSTKEDGTTFTVTIPENARPVIAETH